MTRPLAHDARRAARFPRLVVVGAATVAIAATAGSATSQQRPSFGGTVSRVQVDAIVTDADGVFVDDLGIEDFKIFEDGEPQEILDVQLVDLSAEAADGRRPDPALDEPVAPISAPDSRTPVAPADTAAGLGAMIFLIDGPSLSPGTKARFATAWEELVAETADLRVPRSVYTLNSVGLLDEVVPLTTDVGELAAAVEAVRQMPVTGTSLQPRLYELLDVMNAPDGVTAARSMARGYEEEETARSLATLELLTKFCDALATRPGRTALVWVTTGAKLNVGGPFTVLTGGLPPGGAGDAIEVYSGRDAQFSAYAPNPLIEESQQKLHEAANSANVSIYSIDPTLMAEQRSMGFDVRARTAGDAEALSSFELQSSLDSLRDSMRDAASATGGEAFVYWTDLGGALTEIEQDNSRFYLLTYAAPPPDGDGEYHEIRVDVDRPGITVRERGGYVDLPADQRRSRRLVAALTLPGAVTGPPIDARAFRRWSATGEPIVQVAVSIDSPTGSIAEHVFHAIAVAEDGSVIDSIHQGVDSLLQGAGRDAEATSSSYVHDWSLPPGTYSLRVVIEDELSGDLSATDLDVEVETPDDEWRTSDLLLASSDGSGPAFPLITDRISFGDYIVVYMEVESGEDPIISGDVFSADGTERLAQLPPTALETAAGIHRGALILRGMTPGEIILQVAVTDPQLGAHKIFRQPLTIVPAVAR